MLETQGLAARRERGSAWEIQENDFGWPMVRHRRQGHEATAYVFARGKAIVATCSTCGARRRLDGGEWLL